MDYTQRKEALENFKSVFSVGNIDSSDITSFEKNIDTWLHGVSQTGYSEFIGKVISEVDSLTSSLSQIISDIESRISYLEDKIESQYNANKYLLTSVSSNGGKKEKSEINSEIRQKIRNANLDSSVKTRLLNQVI